MEIDAELGVSSYLSFAEMRMCCCWVGIFVMCKRRGWIAAMVGLFWLRDSVGSFDVECSALTGFGIDGLNAYTTYSSTERTCRLSGACNRFRERWVLFWSRCWKSYDKGLRSRSACPSLRMGRHPNGRILSDPCPAHAPDLHLQLGRALCYYFRFPPHLCRPVW